MSDHRPSPAGALPSWRRGRRRPAFGAVIAVALVTAIAGCAGARADRPVDPTGSPLTVGSPADVVVDVTADGSPIDRRLRGTNVPAWLGPERLASDWLRTAIVDAGVTTIRMPGGSWSNAYGWSACELGEPTGCIWDGAARPSDFAALLEATGVEGIWTVSINETAQSAAALVAFFNGAIGDERMIGVDVAGKDWGRVGDWASVRAENGLTQPVRIGLWEIGNEVFGGSPESGGDECAPFGWEWVWTCDGTEYVIGDAEHDGYLAIRQAMLEVDPTIDVGAVGVADPAAWSDWGAEVVAASGEALDFYVVHAYGFDESPSPDEVARRPAEMWPDLIDAARGSLPDDVPLAITEYNLVSVESGDTDHVMTHAVNALFVADSIGLLAAAGVEIANQWNLANGTTGSGTDYGLVDADGGRRFPQFEGLAVWGRAGDRLLEADVDEDLDAVRVYPTRRPDGSLVVILLHPAASTEDVSVGFVGLPPGASATVVSRGAGEPDAATFDEARTVDVGTVGDAVRLTLPPWSITELMVSAGA